MFLFLPGFFNWKMLQMQRMNNGVYDIIDKINIIFVRKRQRKSGGNSMGVRKHVSQLEFFEGIDPKTIEKLIKCGKIMEVPKGTMLIRARESVEFVYFQLTGKSVIYNLTHDGKRKILFVFGQGALLNEHLFNNHTSSTYCETMEKSKVLAFPVQEFVDGMQEDFRLTKRMLETQERKIWRLGHQLKNTTSSIYLERKLAAKLWKLSRDFGVETEEGIEIDMNLSITFLADMLGVSRETTSRVCSVLTESGLISIKKKRIFISDPEKMAYFYKTGEIAQ